MGLLAVTRAYRSVQGLSSLQGSILSQSTPTAIPSGLTRFINDSSYMPQSETSVAVDPLNPHVVVGGYNDGRYFLCKSLRTQDCPNGYTESVSGFSVSTDGGASVMKSDDLPGISSTETNLTSGGTVRSFLVSWGDPWVAAAPDGTFYYSTLAIDPANGVSGVMLAKSNQNLLDPGYSCATALNSPAVNSCWTAALVYANLTFQCARAGACGTTSFEDKDASAVDMNPSSPYYGDVYVAWNHFFGNGTTGTYLARCDPSLSCVMVSGGGSPVVSGTDPYPDFSTPSVGAGGKVYVAWCNFGTATTFGPVTCESRSSAAGGESFGAAHVIMSFMGVGTDLAGDAAIQGFATEQFRASSVLTLAADTSGRSDSLYFAIAVCTSGTYYVFQDLTGLPTDNPGTCGESAVYFSSSSNGGSDWSAPALVSKPAVVIQPDLAVDQKTGAVVLAYYSTQFDPFNHRIDVIAMVSDTQGRNFTSFRATKVSNEPNADPSNFDYLAQTGGSLVVPQYGDYLGVTAYGGRFWVLFTGNYAIEDGTPQTDPFLAPLSEVPPAVALHTTSEVASPGDRVGYSLSGFAPGASYNLTVDWNGVELALAKGTVQPGGTVSGNFTVPNVQSQVYAVVAQDTQGNTATATLGIGQVSLTGVQGALQSLQSTLGGLGQTLAALQASVQNGFGSLNSSIPRSIARAEGQLNDSIAAVGASLRSSVAAPGETVTRTEYLVVIVLIVAAIALVMQVVDSRKRNRAPATSSPQSGPHEPA